MLPLSLAMFAATLPPTDSPVWAKPEVRAALADVTAKLQICRNCQRANDCNDKRDVEDVIVTLDKLLDAVGEKEAAKITESEGQCLPAKLVALALHRRKNPKLHGELGKTYGDHTQRDSRPEKEWEYAELSRAKTSSLDRLEIYQNHMTEEYRLAWEFRLMVLPRLQEISSREWWLRAEGFPTTRRIGEKRFNYTHACYQVTAEAVYAIGDERSIPTLLAASPQMQTDNDTLDLFTCLARHQTEGGVRAVLDWAILTERLRKEHFEDRGYKDDLKIIPRDLIAGLAKAKGSDWSRLAEKLPEAGLSDREKELRAVLIAAGKK
jgi:hypothetical protein